MGKTQSHVPHAICRKGAEFRFKKQSNYHRAGQVEVVLVNKPFISCIWNISCSKAFSKNAKGA